MSALDRTSLVAPAVISGHPVELGFSITQGC